MTKRPRLSDFGRVSHVTARALAQVLRQVREEGLPNAVSTSSIRRHRREDVRRETDFGDLLQEVPVVLASGGEGSMWVQHPLAMLATVAAEIAEVAELIAEMRELHIVMYSDEITPGQQIKGNDRKCQSVYWSLVNFGPELLCFESMWFTAAALRVSECKKIQGGMRQVYKRILRLFFGGRGRHDLRHGILLRLQGSDAPKLVVGKLVAFLQDERGGKEFALFKGASGVKLCCLCRNICGHKSLVIQRGGVTGFVSSTESDVSKFELHTFGSIRAIVDRLHEVAETGNTALLERLETAHGFNYNREWLLLDRDLAIDLPSVWMWDWFHTYLSDGVFVQEINAFLKELEPHGLGISQLDAYLQVWQWPRGFAHGRRVCRHDDDTLRSTLNGTASEFWSLVPVLQNYVKNVVRLKNIAAIRLAVESALLLLHSVMLLGQVITGRVSADALEHAIVTHVRAHQAAWGDSLWLPKSHYALHLGMLLRRFGFLLATFTQERKHQLIKRFLNPRRHTPGLERGVLEELTLQHLYELKDLIGTKTAALQSTRLASPEERAAIAMALPYTTNADIMVSGTARVRCRKISTQDVVLYRSAIGRELCAGEVQWHAAIEEERWTCVAVWEVVPEAGNDSYLKCRVLDDDVRLLPTSRLLESAIHSSANVGEISTVLIPLSLVLGEPPRASRGEPSRASRG